MTYLHTQVEHDIIIVQTSVKSSRSSADGVWHGAAVEFAGVGRIGNE